MAYESRLVTSLDALLLERRVADGFEFLRPLKPLLSPLSIRDIAPVKSDCAFNRLLHGSEQVRPASFVAHFPFDDGQFRAKPLNQPF